MSNFIKTIIPIAIFVVALGCKKDKPIVPTDVNPCQFAQPTTGDFLIEERTHSAVNAKFTITDTVYNGKNVRFTAMQDDAQYTWYIGTEVLHVKSFERYFGSSLSNTDIPITLVTRKTPNKLCFPNDTGYDSVTKIMHVSYLPDWASPDVTYGPIEGNFRVKSEHLPDSFDIKIDMTFISNITYFNITNYDGLGSNCLQQAQPSLRNYRQVWGFYNTGTICHGLSGDVHILKDNKVEMNFVFTDALNGQTLFTYRKYVGRRI
jgi:hypothetical protein